jgi:hypothetical protein
MSTHSLPSQAFHGGWTRNLFAPLAGLLARWTRPTAPTAEADDANRAAQRVRAYAFSLNDGDPRMAAELMAVADRHERLYER